MRSSPERFFKKLITKWEGPYQKHPEDRGNWAGNYLVGSKYGITPKVYSDYFGTSIDLIHPQLIKRITMSQAVEIAMSTFYHKPRFHDLNWSPLLEPVLDVAYNSGPGVAIKGLQKLIKTQSDGHIGPKTRTAYNRALKDHSIEFLLWSFFSWRVQFYVQITTRRTANLKFLKGWINRAEWYTPKNTVWFRP